MISSVRWTVPSSAIGTTVYVLCQTVNCLNTALHLSMYGFLLSTVTCKEIVADTGSYVFCGAGSTAQPLSLTVVANYASSTVPTGVFMIMTLPAELPSWMS